MRYEVQVIPHDKQPYNTIADWRFNEDYSVCYINVSDMGDEVYHNALALHEETEVMLLLQRMSPAEAIKRVDYFDIAFEEARPAGDSFDTEPGDDPHAPYHIEHGFATSVERMYLAASGKNWKEYEDSMISLMRSYKSPSVPK